MRKAMFAITVLSLVAGLLITSFMDMYLQGFTPAAGQMADDLTPTPLSTIYLVHLPVVLKPRLSDEFEMVERFAPVLKFDGSVKDLPMCADTYFLNMMFDPGVSPVIEDGTSIRWKTTDKPSKLGYGPFSDLDGYGGDAKYYSTIQTADVDGDGQAELLGRGSRGIESYIYSSSELWVLLSPPNRVKNCGRDSCRYGMSNRAYQTLINGEMPTYYRVIYNGQGRARITYWWFYGWQEECNESLLGNDGAHHGDWEHIMVTTSPDRSQIDAVTYYFHSSSYTRHQGSFAVVGEHPVVYVGKTGHGSYHYQDCSGWMVYTPHYCCEYTDFRESIKTPWWRTHLNLVNLDENSESWMLADRVNSQYIYDGQCYTIINWNWGPRHAWCNFWFFVECWDWEHNPAISTHPTIKTLHWDIPSCTKEGCGTWDCKGLVYDCDTHHNQGWPWETLSSTLDEYNQEYRILW